MLIERRPSTSFPYLDHDGVLAFSHRGGALDWPENTMPAFQHSIDLGYRYLETDVHLSADGVLYAFHDDNLKRTTGVEADIADLESSEIDRLRINGEAAIPRLDEILLTWPLARLNIDAKSDASVLPLIKTIRAHDAIDRICVGSFSDRRIKQCRADLGPDLCTSMGPREVLRLVLSSKGLADPSLLVAPCAQLPPTRGGIPITTRPLVQLAHECEIQVHVWTIDDPTTINDLVDLQVDGIMTDRPDILRSTLIERNVWAAPTYRELVPDDETPDTDQPTEQVEVPAA